MTAAQSELLAHPLTIAVVVMLSGAMGWLVSQVVSLMKDNSTWKESIARIAQLLDHVTEKQEQNDDKIQKVDHRLTKLETEHDMVKRAGNLISNHKL